MIGHTAAYEASFIKLLNPQVWIAILVQTFKNKFKNTNNFLPQLPSQSAFLVEGVYVYVWRRPGISNIFSSCQEICIPHIVQGGKERQEEEFERMPAWILTWWLPREGLGFWLLPFNSWSWSWVRRSRIEALESLVSSCSHFLLFCTSSPLAVGCDAFPHRTKWGVDFFPTQILLTSATYICCSNSNLNH